MSEPTGVVVKNESIEKFISQAIEKGLPVESMERFFAMRTEWMQQEAKREFDIAMSGFQGDCPIIQKTKPVKDRYGKLLYNYAPLESIVAQVQPLLKREKLSYSFKVVIIDEEKKKAVRAICTVKHVSGWSEFSEMEVPLGIKTDIMSNSQVTAAAATFAKRYAFINAFGIMTADEDLNGAGTDAEDTSGPVTDEIKAKIDNCKTQAELKAVWEMHRGLGKEFAKMVQEQQTFIKGVKAQEKKDATA